MRQTQSRLLDDSTSWATHYLTFRSLDCSYSGWLRKEKRKKKKETLMVISLFFTFQFINIKNYYRNACARTEEQSKMMLMQTSFKKEKQSLFGHLLPSLSIYLTITTHWTKTQGEGQISAFSDHEVHGHYTRTLIPLIERVWNFHLKARNLQ